MGTSLTGLTPSTTYDALIKVGDNGPLSATAKYLSDGLGNDSILALSNARVGVGTASPSVALHTNGTIRSANSGNTIYSELMNDGVYASGTDLYLLAPATKFVAVYAGNAEAMRITTAGNVGIGTSAPNSKLEVFAGTTIYPINITSSSGGATTTGISMGSFSGLAGGSNGSVYIASAHNHGATAQSDMVFYTHTGSALTEKGRFLSTGGLTFNGDTAAANALDDYEEGTFTPAITFGGGSTGITYANQAGSYTKIGNQVTVNLYIELTNKGSATGSALITGLPFTIGTGATRYGAVSLWINNLSFANQIFCRHVINSTTLFMTETTEAGVTTAIDNTNFANATEVMITATYFV
jgi:hypothetical protein